MWPKGSIIIAQFSMYKITISQNRRSFLCYVHENVKFLSGSGDPDGPNLPSPFGQKFQLSVQRNRLALAIGYLC